MVGFEGFEEGEIFFREKGGFRLGGGGSFLVADIVGENGSWHIGIIIPDIYN